MVQGQVFFQKDLEGKIQKQEGDDEATVVKHFFGPV